MRYLLIFFLTFFVSTFSQASLGRKNQSSSLHSVYVKNRRLSSENELSIKCYNESRKAADWPPSPFSRSNNKRVRNAFSKINA